MAAIYQWFEPHLQVFTTTPYPIEALEAVEFSCDLSDKCFMYGYPEDSGDLGMLFIGAEMKVLRLDLPAVEDSGDLGLLFIGATMRPLRLDLPEVEDSGNMQILMVDAEMTRVKIDVLVPDQGLEMSCDLEPTTCYMMDV